MINWSKIDKENEETIKSIEDRPHIRYIRYLLSKRVSIGSIKKELWRLGLSAPTDKALTIYYTQVVDPLVKKYKLTKLYTKYRSKVLGETNGIREDALNFQMHFGKSEDLRINFLKFVRDMEVGELWAREALKHYGDASNIPVDEKGERILKAIHARGYERILTCDYRYVIDKLLLEEVPYSRISDYLKRNHQQNIEEQEIRYYAKLFFNIKKKSFEEVLEGLVAEKTALEQQLDLLGQDDGISIGELISIKESVKKQIKFLDQAIKEMNAIYTDFSFKQGVLEDHDYINMFKDVVAASYHRFQRMDRATDRDVVDPLLKTVKMMGYAMDKAEMMRERLDRARDKNVNQIMLELYRERFESMQEAQRKRVYEHLELEGEAEADISEIEGLEEL